MRTLLPLLLAMTVSPVLGPALAHAQSRAATSFESFKLVRTRNVFDPDRRVQRTSAPVQERAAAPSAPRTNFLAVTGAMVTADRRLAFFSGSQADYSKVLPVGSTIAGYKITDITSAHVQLEQGGKTVTLPVGSQLPIGGSGAPVPAPITVESQPAAVSPPPGQPPAPGTAAAPTDSPAETSTSPDDIRRRMMERAAASKRTP